MTTVDLYNSFRYTVAINFGEAQIGDVPDDAAAWEAGDGVDVFRMKVTEGAVDYILGEVEVANEDMNPDVFEMDRPHKGLRTADGGQLVARLWSTDDDYIVDTQVLGGTPSVLGRVLGHCLGASALGQHAAVTAVADQTTLTLSSGANVQPGYIVAFAKAAEPDKPHPMQVLTVAGTDITIGGELPFTLEVGDLVYGAEQAWPDALALTNPLHPNYSTLSLLYVQGSAHVWMAGGVHLAMGELSLERGAQPKLTFPILAAAGYAQGEVLTPGIPNLLFPIEGTNRDVPAVGAGTRLSISDVDDPTYNCTSAFSAAFEPGVPIIAEDGVTECDSASPGRVSYRTEPGDTMLTVQVPLTDDQQQRWVQGTYVRATYYQSAPVGNGYAIHIRRGFLMKPPTPVTEGVNKWELVIKATAEAAQTDPALAAKFIIARF